jgi:hypothetical protein
MDAENVTAVLQEKLREIISLDTAKQKAAIEAIYDCDCRMENPYMILHGREEIIKSYATLASNNLELIVDIGLVSFDATKQTAMAEITQKICPKALGGMLAPTVKFFLKLQLERHKNGRFYVTDHHEYHITQDLISQVPIVGGLYDHSIRNAVGQISLAGTSLLQNSGFLDYAPTAATRIKDRAVSVKNKVSSITSSVIGIGGSALRVTGVSYIAGGVANLYWGSSKSEESRDEKPQPTCYSPTCAKGVLCYSPSCVRNPSFVTLAIDHETEE